MSHDRGCPCGKERWDYRECAARRGAECMHAGTVRQWDADRAEHEKAWTRRSANVEKPRPLQFWEE